MSDEKRKDVYPIGKKNPNLPFHPAVRAGDFIFVSGQVAKDVNGNMISGTIEEETAGTIAVSYTHLDVYKRQGEGPWQADLHENLAFSRAERAKHVEQFRLDSGESGRDIYRDWKERHQKSSQHGRD